MGLAARIPGQRGRPVPGAGGGQGGAPGLQPRPGRSAAMPTALHVPTRRITRGCSDLQQERDGFLPRAEHHRETRRSALHPRVHYERGEEAPPPPARRARRVGVIRGHCTQVRTRSDWRRRLRRIGRRGRSRCRGHGPRRLGPRVSQWNAQRGGVPAASAPQSLQQSHHGPGISHIAAIENPARAYATACLSRQLFH